VHVEDVDVINAEPPQACVTGFEQVIARRSDIIRAFASTKGRLGRNQEAVALALDGLAENFLGKAIGVDVRRVEDIDARVQAEADDALGLLDSGGAPCLENSLPPPKVPVPKHSAETLSPESPSSLYSIKYLLSHSEHSCSQLAAPYWP
jgi:hypothetical protein